MNKYILELIKTNNRVNLPGLGALLVSNDNGVKILFNQYLNYDDGLLTDYIAKNESVGEDAAKEKMRQFIASVNEILDRGEKYTMPEIGTFSKADGVITFAQNDSASAGDEGIELVSSHKIDETPAEQQPKAAQPQEKKSETSGSDTTTATPPVTPIVSVSSSNNNMTTRILVSILIFILLLATVYLSLFVFWKENVVYRYFYENQTEEVLEEVAEEPAQPVSEDTVVVEEPKPVLNKVKRGYNIIVGSYKNESGASQRVKDLQGRGFESAYMYQRDSWFVVSIETLPTLEDAEAVQEKIVDTYRIESWIVNAE